VWFVRFVVRTRDIGALPGSKIDHEPHEPHDAVAKLAVIRKAAKPAWVPALAGMSGIEGDASVFWAAADLASASRKR
jgi:hypothetical protein